VGEDTPALPIWSCTRALKTALPSNFYGYLLTQGKRLR